MEVKIIIEQMDALKAELDALRPLRADHLNRLNQKIKLEWNYHSNSIEGNTLSLSETKTFLLWGITAKGKPFRDYLEMKGHNDALIKLYEVVKKDIKITESLIKDFHKLILVAPYTDQNIAEINPGHWKTLPNYLYSHLGERIDFEPPEEVPRLMNELINWLNNHIAPPKRKRKKYDLHPLLIAAGFHARFIQIHPFGDGNGRMARILSNLILMICGYMPAVVRLDERDDYYNSLNQSSLDDPKELAIFLGKSAIATLEMAIKAAKGQSIEDKNDIDRELKLLEEQLKARQADVPSRTREQVQKSLREFIIPLFEDVIAGISKFDYLFEDVNVRIRTSPETSIQYTSQEKEIIYSRLIDAHFHTKLMGINYELKGFKEVTEDIKINFELVIELNKGGYAIYDNLINHKKYISYNEGLSKEGKDEWVRNIQKYILDKIKEVANI